MTKVVHLTSVHIPSDTRIFHKECKTLVEAGYEVVLIVPNSKNDVISGIRIHSVDKPKNRGKRIKQTIWKVLQAALDEDADIYHFHDPELIFIGLILKAKGKKVIYDVHEDVPRQMLAKWYIPNNFRTISAKFVEWIENSAAQRFDGVVAATSFIRERFLKIGCHAIDLNNFPILNELYLPETNWEEKESSVCYVGVIWDKRGLFEIVEAIGLTDANLLLGGNFAVSTQKDKAMIMPGWANVEELGYLNRKEIANVLSRSMAGLVVLHPIINYLDALPVKMFEYMCAGIPVIASNFPLWQEIVEGNECGICVDPMDAKAVAEAIQWIIDNPNEAQRMGVNGRKAVQEKYNWETESEKLTKLYQKILSI